MQNLTIDLTTVRRLPAVYAGHETENRVFENEHEGGGEGSQASEQEGRRTRQDKPGLNPINGTIETNLGLYRAYISLYIYNNPDFSRAQQLLVNVTGK